MMSKKLVHPLLFVTTLLISAAIPLSLTAEQAGFITFKDVKLHALGNSPLLRELGLELDKEIAQAMEVESLQDPQLQASMGLPTSDEIGGPEKQIQVSLTQPIRLSDFGVRGDVSRLLRIVASRENKFAVQNFITKLALAYDTLWRLQIEEQHLKEQSRWGQKVVRLLSSSANSGRFSVPQKKIAQATLAKIKAKLLGLEHEVSIAQANITRLTGKSLPHRPLAKIELNELPGFAFLWNEIEQSDMSVLKRLSAKQQLHRSQENLAQKDRYLSLQPQVAYSKNEDGDNFLGIGFSMNLPLFQGNRAERYRSSSQASATNDRLNYLKSHEFRDEFRLFLHGASAKLQQAKVFQEEVVPKLKEALDSSESLFNNGQLTVLELWEAKSDYHEGLDDSTALWSEVLAMQLEVFVLTGWSYF
ncbi:TolC family protein [bacterium]|nr:TolC family protein [bacterium]